MNKRLFKKYLKGQLSREELNYFLENIEALDEKAFNDLFNEVWKEFEDDKYFNANESEKLLSHVKSKIRHKEEKEGQIKGKETPVFSLVRVAGIAAVLLALIAITFTFYNFFNNKEMQMVATQYGETKTVELPDNSEVKLNANSTIRFQANWNDKEVREVKIEGEGFFTVTSSPDNKKFIVHTDHFNVEVLGTQFNVNNKAGKTQVVLNEGRVKLNPLRVHPEPILMKPGEFVEFSEKNNKIQRRKVNPELYTSWRNNVFIFEDTPINQIAYKIETHYGKQVKIIGEGVGERIFSAEVPMGNLNLLLKLVAKSCKVDITQQENTIIVKGTN